MNLNIKAAVLFIHFFARRINFSARNDSSVCTVALLRGNTDSNSMGTMAITAPFNQARADTVLPASFHLLRCKQLTPRSKMSQVRAIYPPSLVKWPTVLYCTGHPRILRICPKNRITSDRTPKCSVLYCPILSYIVPYCHILSHILFQITESSAIPRIFEELLMLWKKMPCREIQQVSLIGTFD